MKVRGQPAVPCSRTLDKLEIVCVEPRGRPAATECLLLQVEPKRANTSCLFIAEMTDYKDH